MSCSDTHLLTPTCRMSTLSGLAAAVAATTCQRHHMPTAPHANNTACPQHHMPTTPHAHSTACPQHHAGCVEASMRAFDRLGLPA
eukprot:364285-Chlamydomonas_euryale.AAC.4